MKNKVENHEWGEKAFNQIQLSLMTKILSKQTRIDII